MTQWLIVGGAVLFFAAAFWLDRYVGNVGTRQLRRDVFANLDAALDNGYFRPGEQCYDMTALDLVDDLKAYAAGFEALQRGTVLPHVAKWLKSRRQRLREQEEPQA